MELFGGYVDYVLAPALVELGDRTILVLGKNDKRIHFVSTDVPAMFARERPPAPIDFVVQAWQQMLQCQLEEMPCEYTFGSERYIFHIRSTRMGTVHAWRTNKDGMHDTALFCRFFFPQNEERLRSEFYERMRLSDSLFVCDVTEIVKGVGTIEEHVNAIFGRYTFLPKDQQMRVIISELVGPPLIRAPTQQAGNNSVFGAIADFARAAFPWLQNVVTN